MRSTPSRRSDASHSRRIESGFSTCRGGVMGSCSSQTRPHFVKINGRFEGGSSRSSRPTTSSECPSPYTAAVSIQLMPSSSACRIVASDAASSCGPQPKDQPPPPTAHEPNPSRVMCNPLRPSGRVASAMTTLPSCRGPLQRHFNARCGGRAPRRRPPPLRPWRGKAVPLASVATAVALALQLEHIGPRSVAMAVGCSRRVGDGFETIVPRRVSA